MTSPILDCFLEMKLYKELTNKQKRMIARDINTILSLKGMTFPKNIEDIKKLGFFSPRIKVKNREVYLSDEGISAVRRICNITNGSCKYKNQLNYNDIFQSVLLELGKWLSDELLPDTDTFILSLDTALSKNIEKFHFTCRIDGISFDGLAGINIGGKVIAPYCSTYLNGASDVSDKIKGVINNEYGECLIITGEEYGSKSVALEKFYFNAELSLSILRLYSCALSQQSIHSVNIRLINDCTHSYGPASCIGQEGSSKSLIFTRYFRSTQDLKLDKGLLDYLGKELLFEQLSLLVAKESRNELENAIIKSLYWIGESQKDKSRPSSFVKLWSALECFFTLGEDNITERNARGIAAIIMYGDFHHKKFESYAQLKKTIKKYYKFRSKIVHNADFSHIENIQLEEMAFISSWVVIAMVALLERGYTRLFDIGVEAQRLDAIQK